MPTLESDKVDRQLRGKMRAEREDTGDWFYSISDEQGCTISSTSISKGSKHTLSNARVRDMARQLYLDTSQQLVDLVSCTLDRDRALAIMQANCSPGAPRQRR
jgi:hypothetical protein